MNISQISNYDEIHVTDNMTLNEQDVELLKKMFTRQDETKEIIISELLDHHYKNVINVTKELIKNHQDEMIYKLNIHNERTHEELISQEEKVATILHIQENKVRQLLDQWEKQVMETFESIKKLILK
jgi:hypothetical protein